MECPILPVGQAVTGPLPVPAPVARAINEALIRRGYLSGSAEGYDRITAQALARFQDDNPVETAPDTVLAQITGVSGLRFASCATYAALEVPCEQVTWSVPVWKPILGREAAIAAGMAIYAAADQGLVNLRCPVAVPTPGGPSGGVQPTGSMSPWLWVAGLGGLIWLSRRRRVL